MDLKKVFILRIGKYSHKKKVIYKNLSILSKLWNNLNLIFQMLKLSIYQFDNID